VPFAPVKVIFGDSASLQKTVVGPLIVAVGNELTTCVFEALAVPHDPPFVVNVSIAVPLNPEGGVQVEFNVVAFGLKVPPTGVDHVPPMAEPPMLPPKATEVPPWQIALKAAPAFVVGNELTVTTALPVCVTVLFTSCTLISEYVYIPGISVGAETVTLFPKVVVTV
jgi:hypothetical protein